MYSQIQSALSWWRDSRGELNDVEDLVTSSVIFRRPDGTDEQLCPILIGPNSLQSRFFQTPNPHVLQGILATETSQSSRSIFLEKHNRVLERWEPDVGDFCTDYGRFGRIRYTRVILPVKKGPCAMVLTCSSENVIH